MNAVKRAAYDNIRINRFFKTGGGATFISVQKSLQKSNPIIQEGGGDINNALEDVINIGAGTNFTTSNTNRIFNEGNLVKQITEGGYTGTYYNRAGANPTIQSEVQNKYEPSHKPGRKFDANTMGEFSTQGGLINGNRLVSLGKKLDVGLRGYDKDNDKFVGLNFAISGQESLMHQAVGFDVGDLMDTWSAIKAGFNNFMSNPLESLSQPGPLSNNINIGFQPGENIIYQYNGGPGSTYGVGDTILYRYERTSGDYDHQGHPLSIRTYNKHKHTTILGNEIQFFNQDGTFNTTAGLNYLADTFNNNLFGGNNILGENGLLFGDDFAFNEPSQILDGLANQIFGEDTVDFVKQLISGGGPGSPLGDDYTPKIVGSYLIGKVFTPDGRLHFDPVIKKSINGAPTSGFIGHIYTNSDGRGQGNKPGDIAQTIKQGTTDKLPPGVGKVISHYDIISNQGAHHYFPTTDEFSKKAYSYGYNGWARHLNSKIKVHGGNHKTHDGNYRRESRIATGDPGATWTDQKVGIDQINALDVHTVANGAFNKPEYRDLVRFRFEAIRTEEPSKSDVMVFRAFLDNFGDNFTSNWNSFKYNGRGEEFFTYGGFRRTFQFSFKIAAQSRQEMKPLYRKLNYLVSNLAPDYSKSGRMRGPYIKLSLGAYMDRTPGFLSSMSIKWRKDYPFEIALSSPEGGDDKTMHVLPHVLDVSCNFTPIHDFVPRKSVEDSPFIIPGAKSGLHISGTNRKWLTGNNSNFESDEVALDKVKDDDSSQIKDDNSYKDKEKDKTKDDNTEKGNNFASQNAVHETIASKINDSLAQYVPAPNISPIEGEIQLNLNNLATGDYVLNSYDLNGDGQLDMGIYVANVDGNTVVEVRIDSSYAAGVEGGIDAQEIYRILTERYPSCVGKCQSYTINISNYVEQNQEINP